MIRNRLPFLALLLLVGSSARAGSSGALQSGSEAYAEALIQAFHDRCLAAPKTIEGFKGALEGTQQTPEFDRAFAAKSARRQNLGERLVSAAGFLTEPIALVVRVEAYRPAQVPAEVMTCEINWTDEFPESLPTLLGTRIGHPPRGPIAAQGANVYELTDKPRAEWDPTELDVVLVAEKPPIHSISRMVTSPLSADEK